ncbi:MAG: methyltransferase [Candidatus Pacebacteria bacterium]|nr:methyltransferase [Candidatus Paceibacterota bacterium]
MLGQKIKLRQFRSGYRVAVDSVLLAAAVESSKGQKIADLGCGVGAVSLCIAWRLPAVLVTGFEREASLVELAKYNARANGVSERVEVIAADVTCLSAGSQPFDQVVMNPPFHEAASDLSPDSRRNLALREADLTAWLDAAARVLSDKGWLTVIFRADRQSELLAAMSQAGFGAVEILPLLPRLGRPAKRIIVRGQMGATGRLELRPPLILHDGPSGYSAAAEAILQGGELRVTPTVLKPTDK